MFPILAHIRPLDLATGERVDIYVGSAPGSAAMGLGGFDWEPAFASSGRPSGSIELMGLDFSAGIRPATAAMKLVVSAIRNAPARKLYWGAAAVTIYRADELRWPATIEFDGYVTKPKFDLNADTLDLSMAVSARRLKTDLLTETYSGDGASGGDAEKYGTLKPFGAGHCRNIEVLFFDTIRNIGQVDGYGNTLEIYWLAEGLNSFGASQGDFPDYAGLAAAIDSGAIKPGQWATCIAEGLIGLGAPPVGVITVHARFRYGFTGQLMRSLILKAGVPLDLIVTETFGDLDNAVPFPIHYWTSEQVQIDAVIESLADGCNAVPLVTFQGKFAVTRAFGGPVIGTLRRGAYNDPPITDWATSDPIDPIWQMKMRTARPVRVMDLDEVNYADTFVPRGTYSPTETYRQGHTVWTSDGAEWLYIYPEATSGHAPPVDDVDGEDAFWRRLKEATKAQTAQTYRDAADIDPSVHYRKGDLVRDQGAIWSYGSDTPWDGVEGPPALPTEANASWTLILNATVFLIDVNPVQFTIRTDYANAPVAGQIPTGGYAKFRAGVADVTAQTTWTVVTSGCQASIDADGTFDLTAVSANGYIEVRGVYLGNLLTKRIPVTVQADPTAPNPGGGGTAPSTATVTAFPAVSSSTYGTEPYAYATVKAGSGPINFSADLTYEIASSGAPRQINLAGKLVYRAAGSTTGWTDVAPETIGQAATASGRPDYDTEAGYLEISTNGTGFTAGSDYDFGILLRRSSPTSGTLSTAPTGGVTASAT